MIRLTRRRDDGDTDDPVCLCDPEKIAWIESKDGATLVEMYSGNVHEVTESVEEVLRCKSFPSEPGQYYLHGIATEAGTQWFAWECLDGQDASCKKVWLDTRDPKYRP